MANNEAVGPGGCRHRGHSVLGVLRVLLRKTLGSREVPGADRREVLCKKGEEKKIKLPKV